MIKTPLTVLLYIEGFFSIAWEGYLKIDLALMGFDLL